MIKRIGIFLGAIFIALIGIFSVNPLKNTAESQYFNKTIQNAVVETATNEYTFYLDENVNNYTIEPLETLLTFTLETNIEIYTINNETLTLSLGSDLSFCFSSTGYGTENIGTNIFLFGTSIIFVVKFNIDMFESIGFHTIPNKWYYTELDLIEFRIINVYQIKGFKLTNVELENTFNVNEFLTPYIGNLTDFPQPTPQETALDKISSIINSIIDWFITIFNGLGDIFVVYEDGSIIGLSTWGTFVFIPLAIGLVITVLRWVIRLVRGI